MSIATFDPNATRAEPAPLSIHVSDGAARHLAAQLRTEGKSYLRLGVKESGYNGYSYDLAVQVSPTLVIHVATRDVPLISGTQVDYVREGLNATLQFKNANATGYCGCGESFSIAH